MHSLSRLITVSLSKHLRVNMIMMYEQNNINFPDVLLTDSDYIMQNVLGNKFLSTIISFYMFEVQHLERL